MGIKTTVGQVALAGGGLYDQPGNILVEEHTSPLSRGRGRGNLYLLMEVTGPDLERDAVTRLLAQVVHQAYFRWRGSVTAGLREAIRQANELLLNENRNSLPGERRAAGISCLVLRNDDLFIAQAGPAAVYLLRSGEVDRFPDESPWLDASVAEGAEAAALGDRHDVHVHLFHSEIRNGDTILVVGSELASVMSANAWPEILTQPTVGQALQELIARGGVRELSALVIRMGEESAAKVPLHPPPQPEPQGIAQPDAVQQAAPAPRRTTVAAILRQSGGDWEVQIAAAETEAAANALLRRAEAAYSQSGSLPPHRTERIAAQGNTLYRARFGGFRDRSSAESACATLRTRAFDCFVVLRGQ